VELLTYLLAISICLNLLQWFIKTIRVRRLKKEGDRLRSIRAKFTPVQSENIKKAREIINRIKQESITDPRGFYKCDFCDQIVSFDAVTEEYEKCVKCGNGVMHHYESGLPPAADPRPMWVVCDRCGIRWSRDFEDKPCKGCGAHLRELREDD